MSVDAPPKTVAPAELAPFAAIAASRSPNANLSTRAGVDSVMQLAIELYMAARTAVQDIPHRRRWLTGVLDVVGENEMRTQISVATANGKKGADKMWTQMERPEDAARTRATLTGLRGRTVKVCKDGVYEFDPDGNVVRSEDDADKWQQRSRIGAGTDMWLMAEDGTFSRVDLHAGPSAAQAQRHAPAATGGPSQVPTSAARRPPVQQPPAGRGQEKPPFVEAAAAYDQTVSQFGQAVADKAWGTIPHGQDEQVARVTWESVWAGAKAIRDAGVPAAA